MTLDVERLMHGLLLIIASIIFALPALADTPEVKGRALFELCISQAPIADASCSMYIAGFVQGIMVGQDRPKAICFPEALAGTQGARSIFVRNIQRVKGLMDVRADYALAATLAMAFSCQNR